MTLILDEKTFTKLNLSKNLKPTINIALSLPTYLLNYFLNYLLTYSLTWSTGLRVFLNGHITKMWAWPEAVNHQILASYCLGDLISHALTCRSTSHTHAHTDGHDRNLTPTPNVY